MAKKIKKTVVPGKRTRQRTLTMSIALDNQFREYCRIHNLGRTEALFKLLNEGKEKIVELELFRVSFTANEVNLYFRQV